MDRFLSRVSVFIKHPIINEIESAPKIVRWSGGIDDLPTELNPQEVLNRVAEQTGLEFVEEKRTIRVLFVERIE